MPDRNGNNRDRLYVIRPIIDTLNGTFCTVPKLNRLSVNEQMCFTKIVSYNKQYLPNKQKWGLKLFVPFDTMGFAYSGASESCQMVSQIFNPIAISKLCDTLS